MGRLGRVRLAVALIVVVGTSVWLLSRASDGPRAMVAGPSVADAPGDRLTSALAGKAARPLSTSGAREVVEASPEAALAGPSPVPEGVTLEQPPEQGQAVRVLEGRTTTPVPHAIVGWGEYRPLFGAEELKTYALGHSFEDSLDDIRHFRADADGVVLLPRARSDAYAFSEHETLWGSAEIPEWGGKSEVLLRLFPDPSLSVHVVSGPRRESVPGARVAVRYAYGPEDSATLETLETGADGTVALRRLRHYGRYYWAHNEELAVVLAGVFEEIPEARFEPESPPESIELELPPCSELEVLVLDREGALFNEPVLVTVDHSDEKSLEDPGRAVSRMANGGRVVFDQIGLGLSLAVTGSCGEGREAHEPIEVMSAATPGGRATATLTLGPPRTVVTARLLDPSGAPQADARVQGVFYSTNNSYAHSFTLGTDDEGCLRLVLDHEVIRDDLLHLRMGVSGSDGRDLALSTTVTGPLLAQEVPLGDLTLSQHEVIASGRVVDDRDQGIPGAKVHVSVLPVPNSRQFQSLAATYTDATGAFEALGPSSCADVLLRPRHEGFARADAIHVPVGTRGIELSLTNAGGIAGSALFSEDWICDFASVTAVSREDAEYSVEYHFERPGFFHLGGLKTGEYSVFLSVDDSNANSLAVHGVQVVAGEVTRDPRLQEIDLREKVRRLTFDVVDSEGAAVDFGEVAHRACGSVEWDNVGWIDNGQLHLFTMLDAVDLQIMAEEYRSLYVPNLSEGRRLVLEPGIPALFHWAEPLPKMPEGVYLRWDAVPTSLGVPEFNTNVNIAPKPDAETITLMPCAGNYTLRLKLYQRADKGRHQLAKGSVRMVVRESANPVSIGLRLPDEILTALEAVATE